MLANKNDHIYLWDFHNCLNRTLNALCSKYNIAMSSFIYYVEIIDNADISLMITQIKRVIEETNEFLNNIINELSSISDDYKRVMGKDEGDNSILPNELKAFYLQDVSVIIRTFDIKYSMFKLIDNIDNKSSNQIKLHLEDIILLINKQKLCFVDLNECLIKHNQPIQFKSDPQIIPDLIQLIEYFISILNSEIIIP